MLNAEQGARRSQRKIMLDFFENKEDEYQADHDHVHDEDKRISIMWRTVMVEEDGVLPRMMPRMILIKMRTK